MKYEGAGEWGDPFMDLAKGGHWGDVVSNYFSCSACGQMFHLRAETYHGSGGAFLKVESVTERLADLAPTNDAGAKHFVVKVPLSEATDSSWVISQAEAQERAERHLNGQSPNGFRYELLGLKTIEARPSEWVVVFNVISPEGTLIDGPTVILVSKTTGEARPL